MRGQGQLLPPYPTQVPGVFRQCLDFPACPFRQSKQINIFKVLFLYCFPLLLEKACFISNYNENIMLMGKDVLSLSPTPHSPSSGHLAPLV